MGEGSRPASPWWYRTALFLALLLMSGCATILDDDVEFLEIRVPIGMEASQAREIVLRQGFAPFVTIAIPRRRFDEQSQRFEEVPMSEAEVAQQNIGFVKLEGKPQGRLDCFARRYTRLVAPGQRRICWTVGAGNTVTWRQAGWHGATL